MRRKQQVQFSIIQIGMLGYSVTLYVSTRWEHAKCKTQWT